MRLYGSTLLLLGAALFTAAGGGAAAGRSSPPAAEVGDSLATVTLHVEGMTCGGCVLGVRKVLMRLEGVAKADVSYETKRAVVRYDPAKVDSRRMIEAIATLRYTATVVGGARTDGESGDAARPLSPS